MAPRSGFPTSFGNKRASIFSVVGPASYAAYTAPSPGGQDVQTRGPAGVPLIDQAFGAISYSGLYRAEVVQIEASSISGVTTARTQLVLKWYVVSTAAEVAGAVDLSAETVDITVLGPN